MLHILAWLAILTVILFALGEAIRPFRTRHWFKLFFLPGVMLAIGIQGLAARLCVEARYKSAPLHEGEAAFFMQKNDLPPLVGASFVLVSHTLIFAFFVGMVTLFASVSALDPGAIALPSLYPSHASPDGGSLSMSGIDSLFAGWADADVTFVPYFLFLYVVAPVFANLRLRWREYIAAAVLLVGLGVVYFGDFLGLGFPFVNRGWTERLFVFPPWWGTFTLYVLTATVTLVVASIARAGRFFFTPAAHRRRHGAMQNVKIAHVEAAPVQSSECTPDSTRDLTYE